MERLRCDLGGTLSACRELHPDVTVLNSRISLTAHRAILSSLSPLVRSLFASVPAACTVSIILPEVSSTTLTLFIQSLYTGIEKVSSLQPDLKRDLSELAARLDVQPLAGCALNKTDDDSTKSIEYNINGELDERMCSPENDHVQERMQELNITHGQSVTSDDKDMFDEDYGEYTTEPDGLQQNCPEEAVGRVCSSVQCDLSLGYENDDEIEDNTKEDKEDRISIATPDCTIYQDCVEELNDTNKSDGEKENKSKFDDSNEILQKVSSEVDSDEEDESFDKSEATLDDPSWEAPVEEVDDTSEEEEDKQQATIPDQLKLTTKKSDRKSMYKAALKSIPLFKTPQNTKTTFHDVTNVHLNSSQMNTTASSRKKKLFTERIGPQELD